MLDKLTIVTSIYNQPKWMVEDFINNYVKKYNMIDWVLIDDTKEGKWFNLYKQSDLFKWRENEIGGKINAIRFSTNFIKREFTWVVDIDDPIYFDELEKINQLLNNTIDIVFLKPKQKGNVFVDKFVYGNQKYNNQVINKTDIKKIVPTVPQMILKSSLLKEIKFSNTGVTLGDGQYMLIDIWKSVNNVLFTSHKPYSHQISDVSITREKDKKQFIDNKIEIFEKYKQAKMPDYFLSATKMVREKWLFKDLIKNKTINMEEIKKG